MNTKLPISTEILALAQLTKELMIYSNSKTLSPECMASLKFAEFGLYQALLSQQTYEKQQGKNEN